VKVLVVGGGGREHAIVRALLRSPQRPELVSAPGNAGIARDARTLDIGAEDVAGIVDAARRERPDLVVVGPEAPLVAGLVDELAEAGFPAFGPYGAAARLEGSKAFAKEVMQAAGVPTGGWQRVAGVDEGLRAVGGRYPAVIKADGLAAGKGVVIATDEAQARAAFEDLFVNRVFGATDAVVEEHLVGPELSVLALCDGERAIPLAPARDFKRIYEDDEGPNTGGMGAYSPVPEIAAADIDEIVRTVHQPVVDLMRERGTAFSGVLYAGLMLTADGPKVLEFNVRFGDPETQAVLPRLRTDLLDLMLRASRPGGLEGVTLDWDPRTAVLVVLASAGYPASSSKGDVIEGLDAVGGDVEVLHAGTALDGDGRVVTAGGRVLNVVALGDGAEAARSAAYAAADVIVFEGKQLRRDIAAGVA
jgi:phosphoribosylamine--glycine ligase